MDGMIYSLNVREFIGEQVKEAFRTCYPSHPIFINYIMIP
jgi:hypothetical protein